MSLCTFAAHDDGFCRCINPGCTNRVRAADPALCRARCRSTVLDLPVRDLLTSPCRHLGTPTGENVRCRGCPGSPRVHALFACAVHGGCLPLARVRNARCCATCADYQPTKIATPENAVESKRQPRES